MDAKARAEIDFAVDYVRRTAPAFTVGTGPELFLSVFGYVYGSLSTLERLGLITNDEHTAAMQEAVAAAKSDGSPPG